MKLKKSTGVRGRPCEFDKDKVLERALQVFWQKGYEGASLSDLTRAMGINRPSLYAAFGNKEALFRRVLDRYADGPAAYVREALREATVRAVVERLLSGVIGLLADPRTPAGCLMVHGALACGKDSDPIRQELISRRAASEAAIRRRFKRAIAEGDLPADVDPGDLARFIAAVMHGMTIQAVGGAGRAELRRVARVALRAWPSPPRSRASRMHPAETQVR